jgi:hypothetical protein
MHIFMLEVLAVFVGITASLFIDDWRKHQQDREILDHLLEETHYNALQDRAALGIMLSLGNAVLEDALLLAYGDVSAVPDEELVDRFQYATLLLGTLDLQPGYQRLINTSLSIPFDHTMAELDYLFGKIVSHSELLGEAHARILDLRRELLHAAGLIDNPRSGILAPLLGARYAQLTELQDILSSDAGFVADMSDAKTVRAALETPEVRNLLRELIGLRYRYSTSVIFMANNNDSVIASIRRYDPDVTLPVDVIELSGDGTSLGWADSLPMIRDRNDPNLWRLRAKLTDGQVKFRADNNWSSNWGAPNRAENGDVDLYEFEGDPSSVFPSGKAEFGGVNIPVEAGTYDVAFNSQSFEYSFELVSAPD